MFIIDSIVSGIYCLYFINEVSPDCFFTFYRMSVDSCSTDFKDIVRIQESVREGLSGFNPVTIINPSFFISDRIESTLYFTINYSVLWYTCLLSCKLDISINLCDFCSVLPFWWSGFKESGYSWDTRHDVKVSRFFV